MCGLPIKIQSPTIEFASTIRVPFENRSLDCDSELTCYKIKKLEELETANMSRVNLALSYLFIYFFLGGDGGQ